MNRVQELIDENKEQMPTALAKVLLDACKEEADNTKQLYKLTWTMVDSHAHVVEVKDGPDFACVKLSHKTQTLIVSAVDSYLIIQMDMVAIFVPWNCRITVWFCEAG